jgi:hypothetical protein
MEHVTQYDNLWLLKNCMLQAMSTLSVPNPYNLIVGSRLILNQNEFLISKKIHAHSKSFLLEFRIVKRLPPIKSSLCTIILVTHHHFLPKVAHLYYVFTLHDYSPLVLCKFHIKRTFVHVSYVTTSFIV